MAEILVKVTSWPSLLPRISVKNILEIVIIPFLVYKFLVWIKSTRAWNLLRGLLVILVFVLFAAMLHPTTILWTLENTTTIVVTALLVILQLELRKALKQLGSRNCMSYLFSLDKGKDNQGFNDKTIDELVQATFEMAKVRTGTLMMIGHGSSLREIERTGIETNGLVTSQLLIDIFEHNTPLHNGAAVIRDNRIIVIICCLPLADNMSTDKGLGTHHRAAADVGKSADSIIIAVLEEAGRVSVAEEGALSRVPDAENLKKIFSSMEEETVSLNRLKVQKGRLENGKRVVQQYWA